MLATGIVLALGLGALPAFAAPQAHNAKVFQIADGGDPMQFAVDFAASQGKNISEVDDGNHSSISVSPDDDKIQNTGSAWEIDDDNNSTLGYIESSGDGYEIDDDNHGTLGYIDTSSNDGNWEVDDDTHATLGYIEFGS